MIAALGILAVLARVSDAPSAQPNDPPPPGEIDISNVYDGVCGRGSDTEIIICGRGGSDRYRLPPAMRGAKEAVRDNRRAVVEGGLECKNVGPQGCGLKPLPILTVNGSGEIIMGDPDGPER